MADPGLSYEGYEWPERLARAQALALALLDCTTPSQVAETVLKEGIAAFGAAAGSVCLIESAEGAGAPAHLLLVGAVGYPAEMLDYWGRRWPLGAPGPLCDGARTGRPLYLSSAEEYQRLYPSRATEPLPTSRSWVVLPLLIQGRPIGVLGLSFTMPQPFDAGDRQFLERLALQCAVALERTRLVADAAATLERQHQLLKEVLSAVTDGTFVLCDGPWELPRELAPAPGPGVGPLALERDVDVRSLRLLARMAAQSCRRFAPRRVEDVELATSEAAANALRHGGGGQGRLRADKEAGRLQVWVEDRGTGIALSALPQATLQKGFSSAAGSAGLGLKLMLAAADRVYLLTGPEGTTVVLEFGPTPVPPAWLTQC
jgi:anti-sigma regulatory factor (Ser/Thr protein kinase)